MISDIFAPALVLGLIALALGILLAIASVIFKTEKDERRTQIEECLSGANCGGCGFAGCGAYAEAVAAGEAPINLCGAGGAGVQNKIAAIMGIEDSEFIPKKAVVTCLGTCENAISRYDYSGIKSCQAAAIVGGGPKGCSYGCIGFGSCIEVCENNAISIVNDIAYIDPGLCNGCGACVRKCPRGLITLKNEKNRIFVSCKSGDRGPIVKKYCSVGCIACGICTKVCEFDAVHLENNVAVIDFDKCTDCGMCAEKCPVKCIIS